MALSMMARTRSARRRQQQCLRPKGATAPLMAEHERMTVAMALAEKLHHSAQRPDMARAGVWGHELNYTATIRDPPTPQPELFSLYDEEPGGSRPDRMPTLSGPQEQVLRHTVDQIVVAVSALPTFDVPTCRRRWTSWWMRSCTWIRRFPSTLSSKCPRSRAHPVFLVRLSVSRRRRNSWWKRQLSCLSWRLLSSPLTFQFALGMVLVDVFKVFSLARVPPRLWSRSPTFQFLVVVSMEVPKVFTQDRVQQQSQSKSLTLQFRTVAATSKILVSQRFLQKLLEKRFKGFLALFPGGKKVRRWARTRGRNCSPSRAHPRRELMWITGLMATTSGSASTLLMGRFGRGCCRTTCSGTRRGNATDGSMAASGWRLWWVRSL